MKEEKYKARKSDLKKDLKNVFEIYELNSRHRQVEVT